MFFIFKQNNTHIIRDARNKQFALYIGPLLFKVPYNLNNLCWFNDFPIFVVFKLKFSKELVIVIYYVNVI